MSRLEEIYIYPIKSTAGIALTECPVTPHGLELDRRWMLVGENGEAMTAREFPRLVLVRSRVANGELCVSAPAMPELRLGLASASGALMAVQVWDDECTAIAQGAEADRWFSDYLDHRCRLVRMSDAHPRAIGPEYGRRGDAVSFADAFPLLLTARVSLADLNRRLRHPASMRRFRPNLVVDGTEIYAEDDWSRLRVGEVVFEGVKTCPRCVLTTIDPDTGAKDGEQEPLRTLSTYRKRGTKVLFGRNLIPRTAGTVRVGDPIELRLRPSTVPTVSVRRPKGPLVCDPAESRLERY